MKLAAILLLLVGCATTDPSSDTQDEPGGGKADDPNGSHIGYIQTNSPYYWAPSTYDEFLRVDAALGSPAKPVALTAEDALTARLQLWVDRIDAIVRKQVKSSVGAELVAPKPIVKVLPSGSTFNAWVSGTMACSGIGATDGSKTFIEPTMVTVGANYECMSPTYPGATEFRSFWSHAQPKCKVAADGTVSGAGCEIQTSGNAGELEFVATAQYIHVSTDLIASLDERTLVVVLAHELGHYYRSHASEIASMKYNFWYDSEADRKKVPVPSANATQLQTQYAEIVNGPQTLQSTTPGRYSPRFRSFILTSVAPLLTERTEAGFVCATARDALGPWTESLLNGYGIPTEAMDNYLAFESKLFTCASRLNLTGTPGANALSYGTVLMQVMNAKLGKVTLPFQGATLATVLDALNTKAVALDVKAAKLVAKVQQNRIGLYTTEEEADDIALELSARLGIEPDDVIASWSAFMDAIVTAVPEDQKQAYRDQNASCATMLADDFKDANGKPLFVPIGDLSEPHHSDCYRLFNFWREQKLRKYRVTTPVTFANDWEPLRQQAATLSAQAAANGY